MSTFLKLHHGFLEHEKHAHLTNDALLLHISGLMFASERLTDGRLPKSPAVRISWSARLVAEGCDIDQLIVELVDAGIWLEYPDRWEIVNYADHNRTKDQVDAIREANRNRKRKQRSEPSETDTDTETDGQCDSARDSRAESRRDTPPDNDEPTPNPLAAIRLIKGTANG